MEQLEIMIRKAVEPHIGKPIALSGGIDSSLLAALLKPKFAISVELPGDEKYNEIHWAKMVCDHLKIKHIIVKSDYSKFDEYMKIAVKAIGRPIPHFNIFPLFEMFKRLSEMGEDEVVLGDGPDETMCGYARDLIITYLYDIYKFEAFEHYKPLIDKILPRKSDAISKATNLDGFVDVCTADIAMRKDMDDMSNGIARYFSMTNIRPYQDDADLDAYMMNLPMSEKINAVEYGKFALRKIASQYLPPEIAWRKKKVGGPVFPVNILRGWTTIDGEYGKSQYMSYQARLLYT
jgi:asparagine synthetase B (glutamine-hydrolysing)